jgi:hypothetical protein
MLYNHNTYYSQSKTFYNRNSYYRGGSAKGGVYNHPGAATKPFNGNPQAARGYAQPHGQSGVKSSTFSGYDHGGQAKSYSSRGSASVNGGAARSSGGGGAAHSGGGGHH